MNALVVTAVFGILMMFSSFLLKSNLAIRRLALAGILLALIANIVEMRFGFHMFTIDTGRMMNFDSYALLFVTIILACIFLFFLLSAKDMEKVGISYAEYFALIFFITSGIVIVSSFTSLLMLFLGIEIISIPLYILTGSDKRNLKSNEASLKYFLLGAFSTGLMLMGITLLYGHFGSFDTTTFIFTAEKTSVLAIAGILLLMFSMSFKVSAVPFHFWTPDVYDGAPTVFTSFMATIVKAAGFIAFIRLFNNGFGEVHSTWQLLTAIIAASTLIIGNITAVFQQSVKRMLAYSSIAQAGFMMLSLVALNETAKEGLLLYAVAYSIATIGLFAVLIKMKDYTLDGFNGFAKQQPLLAIVCTIFLLSLAGIPLTAGFLAKFYMLKAIVQTNGYLWLAILAVLMAAISVYYYFRIIQSMYFKQGGEPAITEDASIAPLFKYVLVLMAFLIILLGLFPNLVSYWIYF